MKVPSRRLRFVLLFSLLTLGSAWALAAWDWCGPWEDAEPSLVSRGFGQGALKVGGARQQLKIPSDPVRAGYSPPRPDAIPGDTPLFARALVLEVGEEKIALGSVEALLLPENVQRRVLERLSAQSFDSVHLFATHTHSGFGGYDERLVSELAGTGRFSTEAEDSLVEALVTAITSADATRAPATLDVSLARSESGIGLRSEGVGPDERLHLLRFVTAREQHSLMLFAAHPTLQPRKDPELDPDFPGRVSALLEADGGTSLFLQGAVGNTRVTLAEGTPKERMERFAASIVGVANAAVPERHEAIALAHARVKVALPRPEADRLVPSYARAAGENFLCASASRQVEVSGLTLGPLTLLVVPAEVTEAAGRALEEATGASRVLSLGDGYLGYLEVPERVKDNTGEARRQYFEATLLERIARGGKLAVKALDQTSILGSSGSGR